MKSDYEKPQILLSVFNTADVITTSGKEAETETAVNNGGLIDDDVYNV